MKTSEDTFGHDTTPLNSAWHGQTDKSYQHAILSFSNKIWLQMTKAREKEGSKPHERGNYSHILTRQFDKGTN